MKVPQFSGRLPLSQLVEAARLIALLPLLLLAMLLLTDRERGEPAPPIYLD